MKKTLITCAILSLGMISCQNDEFNSMPEENSLNQEIKKIEYLFEEGMEKEEFIYQEGNTKVETSMSFEDRLIYYDYIKRNGIKDDYMGPTTRATYDESTYGLILKGTGVSCGTGRELKFRMDTEDNNNQSYITGNVGDTYIDSQGNVYFVFCIVPINSITFPATILYKTDLSQTGSFSRFFDCEDSGTDNQFYVNGKEVSRSYVNSTNWGITESSNGNVTFYFYNISGNSGHSKGEGGHGVFGHTTSNPSTRNGIIHTDDEDNNNINSYSSNAPSPEPDRYIKNYFTEYGVDSSIKVFF